MLLLSIIMRFTFFVSQTKKDNKKKSPRMTTFSNFFRTISTLMHGQIAEGSSRHRRETSSHRPRRQNPHSCFKKNCSIEILYAPLAPDNKFSSLA